jgi:hypothetical protein
MSCVSLESANAILGILTLPGLQALGSSAEVLSDAPIGPI